MTPEEFRTFGHQVVDWIADYRAKLAEYPVMSTVTPGDIMARLPAEPPDDAESFSAILQDLDDIIMPGMSHFSHPSYFAYFPANASLSAVLGDLISSGLGPIGLNWQASPAMTELEEVVTAWMRQMVGLSEAWQGVIQDSASTSTLVALLCARERTTSHSQVQGGLQAEDAPLIVYTSSQSHSSVQKAALLAGFGLHNLRIIELDDDHALQPGLLEKAIEEDFRAGGRPCAIVLTVGTTGTAALDPVEAVAPIAQKYNIWLHIDSAMAGTAMILPECRWMWQGIEGADSVVLNPHKWLGTPFDCSLYYVRDPQHLIRVMSTNPSYLQTSADSQVKNFRDWGIPLGRRFRALKLWCLIREAGVTGLQARLRRDMANAQWLKDQVDTTSQLGASSPGPPANCMCPSPATGLEWGRPRSTYVEMGGHPQQKWKSLSHSGNFG